MDVLRPVLALLALLAGGLALALLPLSLAGLIVAGGIVVVTTLLRPEVALYLLVVAVPFGSVREINLGGMTVGAAEALIGLALAAWLAQMIAQRRVAPTLPPLTVPLLLFLGAGLLSMPGALSLRYSLKEMVKWTEVLGLYVFTANVLDRERARVLIWVILFTGAAAALHGWYQFFTRSGPEGFLLFGSFMRAYGTFEQPNPYAGYLALIAPLALSLTLEGWPLDRRRLGECLVCAASLGVMAIAIGMSWSRGAWIGFAAAAAAVTSRACVAASVAISTASTSSRASRALSSGQSVACGSRPAATSRRSGSSSASATTRAPGAATPSTVT